MSGRDATTNTALVHSVDVLRSTIDLAASVPEDIGAEADDSEVNWPSFGRILNAFKNICVVVKPDAQTERNCYQALLMMSGPSEVLMPSSSTSSSFILP